MRSRQEKSQIEPDIRINADIGRFIDVDGGIDAGLASTHAQKSAINRTTPTPTKQSQKIG
jgi:hypothetical protein